MRHGPSQECLEQLTTFEQALLILRTAFHHLEAKLPCPVLKNIYGHPHPRYREKSPQQAAMQTVARYISGLKTITILLKHRMLQEDGVIKRTLDELQEDILFLSIRPKSADDATLQKRFMDAFYQEEFDEGVKPIDSTKRRDQIPRRKIRSYIERHAGGDVDRAKQAGGLVYQAYSGYVHSASPHLMEMCSLSDFKFQLSGINDLDLFESHVRDGVNYFVRGFYSVAAVASILGEQSLYQNLKARGDSLDAKWDQ